MSHNSCSRLDCMHASSAEVWTALRANDTKARQISEHMLQAQLIKVALAQQHTDYNSTDAHAYLFVYANSFCVYEDS